MPYQTEKKTLLKSPSFLLSIIILFGIITRIWFFWKDGFHVDEKYTFDLVSHSLDYVIWFSLNNDCNPPLFYIVDWLSVNLIGPSVFSERLPAVIFGILLIPATYLFGKELNGETLGLLSSACVATLGGIWYYSQFGRAYSLECLLFTMLCIYFIRLVRDDNTRSNWMMLSLLSALVVFTHLFSVVAIVVLWAYLIWKYRMPSIKWIVLTASLSSPLLLLFKAMYEWRMQPRGQTYLDWYGAPFNQLVIFAPLEFFGLVFVIMAPLAVYSIWLYREFKGVIVISAAFAASYIVLLAVCDITPVFLRYLIFMIPVISAIAFLPVSDFANSNDHNNSQKIFVIGSFAAFYILITIYEFWMGMYQPKG